MGNIQLYKHRSKQLYYAFLVSLTLIFLACLPLYPYFRLPVHPNLVYFTLIFVLISGVVSLPIAYLVKKRVFPIDHSAESYWSYKATRGYFWVFVLCLFPFFFAFLFFLILARLETLFLGYFLSLCGLILLRPREEDVR